MKKLLLALVVVSLSACVSVPVERHFPKPAPGTTETCSNLKLIPDTDKLSTVVEVVAANYGLYQECSSKVDIWIEWYNKQKEIFDSVK
jgi:hypothetical protein